MAPGEFSSMKRLMLLIGLFDTVAGIADLARGDFSVSDDYNPGVNLYLPPGCARQVIQLQARDERRHNFSLNSVLDGHRQISLPGVHSDIGGGYLPRARERVWLTPPRRFSVPVNSRADAQLAWAEARVEMLALHASGLAGDEGSFAINAWPVPPAASGRPDPENVAHLLTIELDRKVRGELALIALRVMRELGVRHGVPFKGLEGRPDLALPADLQPIAEEILDQVLAGIEVSLTPRQERLLRSRYIHQSAHWVPNRGFLVNKPTDNNVRYVHPNRPQKGYPE